MEFLGYIPVPGGARQCPVDNLRLHMTVLGLTEARLAKAIGVDESTVNGWLTGRHAPSKKSLERIEHLLKQNGIVVS
jgi:transcriptional regulator with XRE-family HTH domain